MKKANLFLFASVLALFSIVNYANAAVLINEFLPNGVSTSNEWIEIYNNGESSVNISEFNISDEGGQSFTIIDFILESKSFVVLVRSDEIFNRTYNTNSINIIEYENVAGYPKLNNDGDSIFLYDPNGQLVDSVINYKDPGKEVSIGRYPDGSSELTKLLAQTPGSKNDNLPPKVEWVYPTNGTYVNYLVNVKVNIMDDTATIIDVTLELAGESHPMLNNGNEWSYMWDTSLYEPKQYNLTIFFKDSYGKQWSEKIYDIGVNNEEITSQLNKAPAITLVNLTNTDSMGRANGTLKISWSYEDEDNDEETEKEVLWFVGGSENTALRNLILVQPSELRKGQVWTAGIKVFDGKNWSLFHNSTPLTISNSPPTQTKPIITSNGNLSCSSNVIDLDMDETGTLIRWYKNNLMVESAANSETLNQKNYSKNDNIVCEITPIDNYSNGTSLNSSPFRIANTAPVLVSEVQNKAWNSGAQATINLINTFMDMDGDKIGFSFNPVENITIFVNETTKIATLIPAKGFVGTRKVRFTASDGEDSTISNEIILTVKEDFAPPDAKEAETRVDEVNNVQLPSQEASETEVEEEPVIITGKAIDEGSLSEKGENKKSNYLYAIGLALVILVVGGFFGIKKLSKKNQV